MGVSNAGNTEPIVGIVDLVGVEHEHWCGVADRAVEVMSYRPRSGNVVTMLQ